MNRIHFLWLLLLGSIMACEEISPLITPASGESQNTDIPVAEQERQVLIEEFSGVQCVNCPAGSEAIEDLINIHGPQLVAVSIHSGFFAKPYDESRYDFQTQTGDNLLNYLEQPLGYPSAVVNRKQFEGEESLQLNRSEWAGYIANELNEPPKIKIDLKSDYQDSNRSLSVDVDLFIQENITANDIRLTVLITEDNISDFQLTPQGKIGSYSHRHVLRDILTDFQGMRLTGDLLADEKVSTSFRISLPPEWLVKNCAIVAFVNLNGDSKDVLQAHQIKMLN